MKEILTIASVSALVGITSLIILIYVDSVKNYWEYAVRKMDADDDITPAQPEFIYDPLQGHVLSVSPVVWSYGIWLFIGFLPVINTLLLIHSIKPFLFFLKTNALRHTDQGIKNYLDKNPEVKSKIYHSIVLRYILKFKFKFKTELLF